MKLLEHKTKYLCIILLVSLWQISYQLSEAGPLRNMISKHRSAQQETAETKKLPPNIQLIQDIPYGKDIKNRMDVYFSPQAKNAPVIFMVHGGAWQMGDKAGKAVIENKVRRWVPQGYVFISTNYRLVPQVDPLIQVTDIARALAVAQKQAPSWGGDPSRFILIGHSAGSHLVAVLTASPSIARKFGVKPWLGTILLDSAALDVVKIMEARHPRFYNKAFGRDIAYWKSVSPIHLLTATTPQAPYLLICSSEHRGSCSQSNSFANKASTLGIPAKVLEVNMSHKETNQQLGADNRYTQSVESFLGRIQ